LTLRSKTGYKTNQYEPGHISEYAVNQGYLFPLSIQITLPKKYRSAEGFRGRLSLLQEFGFSGVELNIEEPEGIDPSELKAFLHEYGLKLTMLASGAAAKTSGLSLSHESLDIRDESVRRSLNFIDFAAEFEAGVIIGFLKGGISPDVTRARDYFKISIGKLESRAGEKSVPLLIEATNRYESAVANSLDDTVESISGFRNPFLRILPDTFHMNIEEVSMQGALEEHRDYYNNLHISDNNRLFPGLGGIDFPSLFQYLGKKDYSGGIAIEGNLKSEFETDLKTSMAYLIPLLQE
jgi:sugar phosphate isomerase/epimerase